MHIRSSISLCKFLRKNPFGRPSKPGTPIFSRPLTILSNQSSPHGSSRKGRHLHRPSSINPPTHFKFLQGFRDYSVDIDKEVDKINLKFAEAREEIESAMDSKETVYFNEEAECAREAVGEVLEMYEGLLKMLPESERSKIQRAMGLKIEQLKAELEQLNE